MSSNGRHFGEIRLSALKKAPEMFGSVYEHEEKKPMERSLNGCEMPWHSAPTSTRDHWAVGLQTGGRPQGRSQGASVRRFRGARTARPRVAGMLLRAVIDYGREHVEQIMLTVAEGNEAAINLYQRSARCPAPLQSPRRSAGRQSK
ncbi:GNAT family N-acetyltransferase [Escherichia coli]|uniref:GNAT family N-acetyltransferase n=1 Tax=Escherichia coli TaxID=562 RepID=UPI003D80A41A